MYPFAILPIVIVGVPVVNAGLVPITPVLCTPSTYNLYCPDCLTIAR